jgi:hypothetical protein
MAKLLVFAVLSVVGDALSNLGSLHNINGSTNLPDVKALLPSRSFSATKSTVEELERRIVEEQRKSVDALEGIKADYEKVLEAQNKNNSLLQRENRLIAARARAIKKYNDGLRQRATDLVKSNTAIKRDLETLSSNLTLAQEFVQEGLAASVMNASDTVVLSELAAKDEVARANYQKQELLGAKASTKTKVSLMGAVGDIHERSSDAILESLSSSLATLSSGASESTAMLKEAFEKKLTELTEKHEALLKENAALKEDQIDAEVLSKRLYTAIAGLTKSNEYLSARVKAVKAFAERMGRLQTS